ncbi:hypothetical protein KUTeg_015813 [Tegillarca granosa]|uniref:Lysosomal-associated transmembrane protein 4A n=1 Tax=Tegillarca granosa TaxID=220873 RepID=A0ABQ9EJ22_TEGGR|nr:hypothetical protein KUTeg_015813 [Tegillarca granosa]
MKLKFDSGDQNSFRCCFCCHVRTGTILLGLWHLLAHLFVIGALIFATFHPEVLKERVKCPSSGNDDDLCVAFVITMCTLTITLFLLYGAIKSRPGYLMPFFCLQVFDFCLSCLTVVGYFSYAPNIKDWFRQQGLGCYPGMDSILRMDGEWLMLLCLLVLVLFLSLKAYLIGVVWACYKYLQLRNLNRSVVREYTVDPDTEMLLPPKYEDAIKAPVDSSPPPPPYTN